jgi:hypothetical protein
MIQAVSHHSCPLLASIFSFQSSFAIVVGMPSTNLVIAVVFAGLFGIALVWLAFYYIHRYIHLRCLELDHWFHIIIPPAWRSPCRHCEGTGRAVKVKEKSRSSSSRRRERSKSKGRRERSRHDRGGHGRGRRMIEADTEWDAIGHEREHVQRARQTLPSPSIESRTLEQQYNLWQGQFQSQMCGAQQKNLGYQQQAMYPQTSYSQTYQQTFPQPWPHNMAPLTMATPIPQQQAPHLPMPVPSSIASMPAYQRPHRKVYTERSESQAKPKATKGKPEVKRGKFIQITEEYPDIIKDSIKKAAPTEISSFSSSSSSSTSTDSTEEVPRKTKPQSATHFAQPQPFQFPQNSYLTSPGWEAPTSHPRQWSDHTGGGCGPDEQRYATFYTRPEAWILRPHTPSNTRP